MIINHNMNALNAHRNMIANTSTSGKSMEKLSSGLRINRAGDDAAGLAISEKMRGQIRGLDQASRNAQDGISMIQTAEGALNETHSILQRMRELSVQSGNDTNTDDDRLEIQKEISQLTEEIDRIGNNTEFNTKKLIDGSIGGTKTAGTDNASVMGNAVGNKVGATATTQAIGTGKITANGDTTIKVRVDGAELEVKIDGASYKALDAGQKVNTNAYAEKLQEDINKAVEAYNKQYDKSIEKVTVSASAPENGTISIASGSKGGASTVEIIADTNSKALGLTDTTNVKGTGASEGVLSAAGAGNITALKGLTGDDAKLTFEVDGKKIAVDLAAKLNSTATTTGSDMSAIATELQKAFNEAITAYNDTVPSEEKVENITVSVKDGSFVFESGSSKDSSSIKFDKSEAAQLLGVAGQSSSTQGGGVEFQIGANQGQSIKITIDDMRSEALGVDKIDVSTKEGAQEAITTVDDAIKKVSAQRANLGAVQNRLEHTINNLGTSSENLTAAESRVRDVDMAKEMMTFSKNNILAQAAQSMLAQANQQPQQVLSLLR